MTLLSDLAGLFAPYESGTKVANTNITIDGSDLSDLFAPASQGAASVPTTGISAGGADIATLFAAAGTTTKLSDVFKGFYTDYVYGSGEQTATASLTFLNTGAFQGSGRTGRWLAGGFDPAEYEVLISLTSGNALDVNDAATYQPLSSNRSAVLSVTVNGSNAEKQSVLAVTIRKIAAPTELVTATVTIIASAESWGTGTYPP